MNPSTPTGNAAPTGGVGELGTGAVVTPVTIVPAGDAIVTGPEPTAGTKLATLAWSASGVRSPFPS